MYVMNISLHVLVNRLDALLILWLIYQQRECLRAFAYDFRNQPQCKMIDDGCRLQYQFRLVDEFNFISH